MGREQQRGHNLLPFVVEWVSNQVAIDTGQHTLHAGNGPNRPFTINLVVFNRSAVHYRLVSKKSAYDH